MRTIFKKTFLFAGLPALAIAVVSFGALARGTRPEPPPGPTPANEDEARAAWTRVIETHVDHGGRVDFAGLSKDRGPSRPTCAGLRRPTSRGWVKGSGSPSISTPTMRWRCTV